MRDHWTVVDQLALRGPKDPDGPVAIVTTSGGLAAHLTDFGAVMDFLDRHGGGGRFAGLEDAYRDAEVRTGRRPPEVPKLDVADTLDWVTTFDHDKKGAA